MSVRRLATLTPLDSFFFPDHRPFNQDDPGLGEAATRFPPPPHVMAGAVRFAIARELGWEQEREDWQDFPAPAGSTLGVELGSGPFAAGHMRFGPPQLMLDDELFYPAPRFLVGRFDRAGELLDVACLLPGPPVTSDAPFARLCTLDHAKKDDFEPLTGWWLKRRGLELLLEGKPPGTARLQDPAALMAIRPRVGLQTDYEHHRPRDGMLYAAAHGAFKEGLRSWRFACRVEIGDDSKLEQQHLPQSTIMPFGSRGRAAEFDHQDDKTPPKSDLRIRKNGLRYFVTLLSPAWLTGGPVPAELELPGELVAAIHDRAAILGAWHHGAIEPRTYQRLYPAGSTWFFEATGDQAQKAKQKAGNWRTPGIGLGLYAEVGFGAAVMGTWSEREE